MNRLIKNNQGQFVIIIALLIAALTLATIISIHEINIHNQSIAYKPANEFLLGITSDMNRALTVALANYTDRILNYQISETTADSNAHKFMDFWKKSTLTSYSSYGIKIRTDLDQNLNATFLPPSSGWVANEPSISFAYMRYALDVNSYGFIGWTGTTTKYVQLQITNVAVGNSTRPTTVEFQLMQSDINKTKPISDLHLPSTTSSQNFRIYAYNPETNQSTLLTGPKTLTYLGKGNYRVTLNQSINPINPIRKSVCLELATPNDIIWIQNNFTDPKANSTTITILSASSPVTFGQYITDTANVTADIANLTSLGNDFPTPSGEIQFLFSNNGGASWSSIGPLMPLNDTGMADSIRFAPQATGNYLFRAVYFGDDNYNFSQSEANAEPMTVNKVTPTVTTKLSETAITLGGSPSSITDEVTVSNMGPAFSFPTGHVTFQVRFGSTDWSNFSTVALNPLTGKATSVEYTPLAAGTYYFRAVYDGDPNYNSAQSGDEEEPLTVNKATPKVTTLISPPAIILGGSVTDTATVTGLEGEYPAPTGTVTFEVSIDGGSSWSPFTSDRALVGDSATSDLYTTDPSVPTYYFRAVYSGDSNYVTTASGDQDEPLTPGLPSLGTIVSSRTIPLGNSVYDIATVTGIEGFPIPTGTILFQYRKGTSSTWNTLSTETLIEIPPNTAAATSPPIFLTSAGDWYFRAVYSGDSKYTSATTGDTAEPLIVTKANPTVTTKLSSDSIALGQPIFDTATVTGLGGIFPAPTGLVDFQVSQDGGLTWTAFGSDKTLVDNSATSDSYTPNKVGTNIWYFRAYYQGDENYNSATSDDLAEPLTVDKGSTATSTLLSASTITQGQGITDKATVTVSGIGLPPPTGTVTFKVSVDGGTTWKDMGLTPTKILSSGSGGSVISDLYVPFSAGAFNFKAIYSGDSNYLGSESTSDAEPLYVNMEPGTIGTLIISSTSPSGKDAFISNSTDSPLNPCSKVDPPLSSGSGKTSTTMSSNFLMPSIVTSNQIFMKFTVRCVGTVPYQTIQADLEFTYDGHTYSIGTATFDAALNKGSEYSDYPVTIDVTDKRFGDDFPVQAIPAGSILQLTVTLLNPINRIDLYGGVGGTQIKLF